jgi:transcriptional regulator with XRE-family HTH domain
MKFGELLRQLRSQAGLSVAGAARSVGITRSSWVRYELNLVHDPRPDVLVAIAHRFNTDLNVLRKSLGAPTVANVEEEARRTAVNEVLQILAQLSTPKVLAMPRVLREIVELVDAA